jgi:hypothetical protein
MLAGCCLSVTSILKVSLHPTLRFLRCHGYSWFARLLRGIERPVDVGTKLPRRLDVLVDGNNALACSLRRASIAKYKSNRSLAQAIVSGVFVSDAS